MTALADRVGNRAVNPDRGENQRYRRKEPQQLRESTPGRAEFATVCSTVLIPKTGESGASPETTLRTFSISPADADGVRITRLL